MTFTWVNAVAAISEFSATTVNAPTRSLYKPKFLEKELATKSSL